MRTGKCGWLVYRSHLFLPFLWSIGEGVPELCMDATHQERLLCHFLFTKPMDGKTMQTDWRVPCQRNPRGKKTAWYVVSLHLGPWLRLIFVLIVSCLIQSVVPFRGRFARRTEVTSASMTDQPLSRSCEFCLSPFLFTDCGPWNNAIPYKM